MFKAEWYEGTEKRELVSSADDVRREMVDSIEPIRLAQLVAWMRTAEVGESYGAIEDGWAVARIG
jgi:hypothetical protein